MVDDIADIPDKKKDGIREKMIAVVIVTVVIASSLMLMFMSNDAGSKDVDLKSGDYLNYSVTTNRQGNITDGCSNTTIEDYGYQSMFSLGIGLGKYHGIVDSFDNHPKYDDSAENLGFFLEDRVINTSLGEKRVSTYVCVKFVTLNATSDWIMVITDVGIDSNLIYRWTLSNEKITTIIALNDTNNERILNADDSEVHKTTLGSFDRIGVPGPIQGINYNESMLSFGLLKICDGDIVTYNSSASNVSIFFISIENIEQISHTAQFQYDATMSSLNVTQKNMSGNPGHYLVLITVLPAGNNGEIRTNWGGNH